MAAMMMTTATTAISEPDRAVGAVADGQLDDCRRDQHRHQVHHLDQRVDGRAGGVLERVTDGVTDHGGRVRLGTLAAVDAVLDQLLGVVPGTTGVGQEHRHQGAGGDRAAQVAGQRADAQAEADRDRRHHREQPRGDQLAQRVPGADVDHPAVLRPLGAVHDPGVVAELRAHLVHHGAGRPGHRVDRQARRT